MCVHIVRNKVLLCQLFKGVALLIPIDNLPVKSTIFFFIIEKCSLVQYTFFNITVIFIKSFFHLVTFKTQVPLK